MILVLPTQILNQMATFGSVISFFPRRCLPDLLLHVRNLLFVDILPKRNIPDQYVSTASEIASKVPDPTYRSSRHPFLHNRRPICDLLYRSSLPGVVSWTRWENIDYRINIILGFGHILTTAVASFSSTSGMALVIMIPSYRPAFFLRKGRRAVVKPTTAFSITQSRVTGVTRNARISVPFWRITKLLILYMNYLFRKHSLCDSND